MGARQDLDPMLIGSCQDSRHKRLFRRYSFLSTALPEDTASSFPRLSRKVTAPDRQSAPLRMSVSCAISCNSIYYNYLQAQAESGHPAIPPFLLLPSPLRDGSEQRFRASEELVNIG